MKIEKPWENFYGKGSLGIELELDEQDANDFYMAKNTATFTYPKHVGGYRMGKNPYGPTFNLFDKPSFIKRFLMKHLLGFEWVDK